MPSGGRRLPVSSVPRGRGRGRLDGRVFGRLCLWETLPPPRPPPVTPPPVTPRPFRPDPPQTLRPWAECPDAALAGLRGVLTDIDDTLTRDGQIEPAALAGLQRLAAAGLPVIAVTGRPAGWSRAFALAWPVRAIVAENGALMWRRRSAQKAAIEYADPLPVRQANAERLATCARAVLAEVPGTALARDSAGRITDIAIDHSEFAHLPPERIAQVVALMQAQGLTASVSSIHINGWIGAHHKFSGACWAVRQVLGGELRPAEWLYVGDSSNDQVMFERLPLSVGVANIARFVPLLTHLPTYVTRAERGAGFAEVAKKILAARPG